MSPAAPARGSTTVSMAILALGAAFYGVTAAVRVAMAATGFASATNAITFPLQPSIDTAVPPGTAPDAFGYFATATLSSSAVTWWPQAWLSLGGIVDGLVHLSIAVLVAIVASKAMRGRLLQGGLSKLLLAAGLIVAVGGTAARAFSGWGLSTARAEIIAANRDTLLGGPALPLGDWLPLLLGLAVIAVAIAVRGGERAQRDTEGLV